MLVFRQLFDPSSSTYTYLLADGHSGKAVVIDPVFEQVRRDAALIEELGLDLVYSLETHVHADHVTGAWLLRQQTGCGIALSADSGAVGADRYLVPDDVIAFGGRNVQVRKTPGHTNGCLTYVLDDRSMAFTGDCLMVRGSGRTDFQQGDPSALYRSVHQQIFTLPDTCLLYPAHDYRGLTVTSVREERRYNPRLGGESGEADFAGYMKNLRLAHPKKLDVAVPANLKCGKPEGEVDMTAAPNWAPLRYTFAGIWEIDPHGLEEHARSVQVLDVREPEEFSGPLGHIHGASRSRWGHWPSVPASWRTTGRSSRCAGPAAARPRRPSSCARPALTTSANLAGGMLRWRAEGHPVEGGSAMEYIAEYSI